MTNNQHWQVPEALIDLIDAYAETRYRCGGIYNARTEAARNAVIEALSGVQALSAAPAVDMAAVDERQAFEAWYKQDCVIEGAAAKLAAKAAWKARATLAATPTPPAEQPQPHCSRLHDADAVHGNQLSVYSKPPSEQQAEPGAADRTGCTAGTDEECTRRGCATSCPAQQAAPKAAPGEPFQHRVQPWLLQCFGAEIAADTVERNHRFLEEALELVQSTGCTQSEAHQLVDYVFGRPVGEPAQEVGGVMVTLAALCLANGLDMHNAGEIELARIWTKVEAIRAKQAAKPKHSPLPQAAPQQEAQEPSKAYAWVYVNKYGVDSIPASKDWCTAMVSGHGGSMFPLYTAPQPKPAPLSRDQIREVFMAHGFTIKEGQTDLKQYVYDAAHALLGTKPAPLSDDVVRGAAFEAVRKKLCALPRFSFFSDGYGAIRRVPDKSGSWIAFDAAHALFDPVAVDAALAAQGGK